MPRIKNQHRKAQLALALAGGSTAIEWAKENNVPESTTYRWANSPEVEEAVNQFRQQIWEQTISRLIQHAAAAAAQIVKLAEEAASESVRLSASRAVLADLMAVSNYAALERRLCKVERRLREQDRASVIDVEPEPGSTGATTDENRPRRRKRSCPA